MGNNASAGEGGGKGDIRHALELLKALLGPGVTMAQAEIVAKAEVALLAFPRSVGSLDTLREAWEEGFRRACTIFGEGRAPRGGVYARLETTEWKASRAALLERSSVSAPREPSQGHWNFCARTISDSQPCNCIPPYAQALISRYQDAFARPSAANPEPGAAGQGDG